MTGAIRSKTGNLGLALLNFGFPNWGDDANRNTQLIDTAFAILGTSISGSWENLAEYTQGELLVDTDTNEVYRALVTHTSAASGSFADDRSDNPSYWQEVEINFSIRGPWETATAYLIGDIVYDETQHLVAVALTPHTSGATLRIDEAAGKWAFVVDMKASVDAALAAQIAAEEAAEAASEIAVGDLGGALAAAANKPTFHVNDRFTLTDSEDSFSLAHAKWSDIVTNMQTALDSVYAALSHTHAQSDITGLTAALALLAPLASPTFTGTLTAAAASFTGAVSFASTVALAADPTTALQAATKQYVDSLLTGIYKRLTVRVATTANISIANALNNGDTLDSVTLASDDYVLVKNQSNQEENGIYKVAPIPARVLEFDTFDEHPGSLIAVQDGTTNADTIWICTSNRGGTLNTDPIVFSKLVIAGELLAANNLSDVSNAATAFGNIKQAATTGATGVVEKATAAELRAAAADKYPDAALIESASALITLTDAAPIAVDWDSGFNFEVTVTAARQIGNPTNGQPGTYRTILVKGNDGTSRVITFGNQFLGEVPEITDASSTKWFLITIRCIDATHFVATTMQAK